MSGLDDPRVQPQSYAVFPTGYDDMAHSDKDAWALEVADGGKWGWSVRHYGRLGNHPAAMNRQGKWIYESRGHRGNRFRRYPLEDALLLALKHVDTQTVNGYTAAQASERVAARLSPGTRETS